MREVFSVLTREFTHDKQWRGFIHSAWAAWINPEYRHRLRRAGELKSEIATTAEKLSKLICQYFDTGVTKQPIEFHSVRELLRQAEPELNLENHELHEWQSMRQYLLGDSTKPHDINRNAWFTAPDLSTLLLTVARAARDFTFTEGFIGTTFESRKCSQKMEYLRAFGYILTNVYGVSMTKPVMRAMAATANVVINSPEIDATYDDMRKVVIQGRNSNGK
jgi:predicted enzyme related to lactoylglutathione lyase